MKIPTPNDLDYAPELAVLAALEAALEASRHAVIASTPELRDAEDLPLFARDTTGIVKTLINLMEALREQIDVYRLQVATDNQVRYVSQDL